jgi:hypothetical protein
MTINGGYHRSKNKWSTEVDRAACLRKHTKNEIERCKSTYLQQQKNPFIANGVEVHP